MANITQLINNIRNAVFGKDVRESIASAIEQTYEDASEHGNANMEVVDARGTFDTLKKRLDNSDNTKADNSKIDNLQLQINELASGSPLVASSTSEMTDTTRVYVNTTDGYWYYYDGAAWSRGMIYTDNTNYNTIFNNIEEMERMIFNGIIPITNYVDNANVKKGYRYDRLNVNELEYSSTFIAKPFPVKSGITYRSNGIYKLSDAWSHICDRQGNIIEATFPRNSSSFFEFTPSKDGYAYLTFIQFDSENDRVNETMVSLKDYMPDAFTNYNEIIDLLILNKSYNNLIKNNKKIEVGPNKSFTSIASAIASITSANKNNIYDILIDDGIYEENNLIIPDYVNLIGASGNYENCEIKGVLNANETDANITAKSTLNLSANNIIKNLKITAKNMRYAIHHESGGEKKNWSTIIDNCYVEHFGNQEVIDYRIENELDYSNVWKSCHAWGEGASSGAYLRISNTTIKSVESAFYVHGASDITKPYYHELINCELIVSKPNEDSSIYVNDTTTPINGNTLVVKDCSLNGRVSIVGTPDYNMIISGSGLHPVYQKPERVLSESDFPIFTDYVQELKANENINKGVFVYTLDGKTIQKANSSTPSKLILGYTIGNHSSGDMVKIMKGYLQPINQTWPETDSLTAGKYYKVGNAGTLVETNNVDEAIAISSTRFYKLFI